MKHKVLSQITIISHASFKTVTKDKALKQGEFDPAFTASKSFLLSLMNLTIS